MRPYNIPGVLPVMISDRRIRRGGLHAPMFGWGIGIRRGGLHAPMFGRGIVIGGGHCGVAHIQRADAIRPYRVLRIKRAHAMRPYGGDDFDDAVDVVGHNDEFMQSDVGTHGCGFKPFVVDNLAHGVQCHLTIGNGAE